MRCGLALVANDAHPGSNVTGILMRVEGLPTKQLQIATQTVPGARRIGVLINPASVDAAEQRHQVEIEQRRSWQLPIQFVEARVHRTTLRVPSKPLTMRTCRGSAGAV